MQNAHLGDEALKRASSLVGAIIEQNSKILRGRVGTILGLALPIIIQSGSQSLLTLVDTAMVGVLGNIALAAVGVSNYAYYIVTALMSGLGMCSQIMTARRKGEEMMRELAVPLNGALLLGLVLAIPLSLILFFIVPEIFSYLNRDPEVIAKGVPYLQARVIGIIGIAINFSHYGYLTGIGRTGLCLRIGLAMQLFNVFLNYSLIFGHFGFPQLGSTGAGIGSTIATFTGSALYTIIALKMARDNDFLKRLPTVDTLNIMIRLAATSALQQFFFAAGFAALIWVIGRIGVRETAAANVLLNITLLVIIPCMGLGLAAATLVGQALGRGEHADAKKWGWDATKMGMQFMGVAALLFFAVPHSILSLFLHDPETLSFTRPLLQLTGFIIFIDGFGLIMLHGLIGAGDTTRVMVISVLLQWGLFLPAAFLFSTYGGYGLSGVWIALCVYRLLNALIFGVLWRQGKWTLIKV